MSALLVVLPGVSPGVTALIALIATAGGIATWRMQRPQKDSLTVDEMSKAAAAQSEIADDRREDLHDAREELKAARRDLQSARRQMDDCRNKIDEYFATIGDQAQTIALFHQQLEEIGARLADVIRDRDRLKSENGKLKEQVTTLELRIGAVEGTDRGARGDRGPRGDRGDRGFRGDPG